jgi:hypothetical protein
MKKQNLTEEIYRMRKLMNFDSKEFNENVTSLEKLSEEIIRVNNLLSEQNVEEQLKITKKKDGDFRVTKGKRRHIGKSSKSGEVDYEDEDWSDDSEHRKKHLVEKFKQKPWSIISGKMMSHMSEKSKSNWTELINDPDNVKYAWEALELYDDDYSNLKGKQKKKLKIIVGHDEQIKYEIVQKPDDEIPDITVPVTLPIDSDPSELFKDCKYEPTNEFVSEVDALIKKIEEQKKEMVDPQIYCTYINVESSASRLRNICNDKNLSWLKLSKLRNDSAVKYLRGRLSDAGVLIDGDTKIYQDYKGKNGDGSSGPNPPKGFKYNNDGTASFRCGDSSTKGQKCKGTRGDFGEPHSSREDYDEYKFVLMDVGLIFKGQREPDPKVVDKEPEVKEIKTESYDIQFYVPPTGFSFWLPKIMIKLPKWKFKWHTGKYKKGKNWGKTDCPKL